MIAAALGLATYNYLDEQRADESSAAVLADVGVCLLAVLNAMRAGRA